MSAALEIRGLEKKFAKFALGPIDLTVPAGAIYGFVGPNGAGKTTTIDLIFGMGAKDAGEIRVLGLDHLKDEVAMKQQVGYVSPDLNYAPWGKVGRAIQFVKGFYPTWDDAYCEQLLKSLSVGKNERIMSLSFGARIKLSLILALSWRPKLLILDEPTVGLDAISKQEVFSELLSAVGDGERSVLISSHGLTDLERFADHVGMIKNGKMLFEGSTAEMIDRHRIVDFIFGSDLEASRGHNIAARAGVFVQAKQADRWRVLLDLKLAPMQWLRESGATQITETPVTLEELFVAIGRE
jgi:ABC-2 type transport system ATP-binding protein